MLQFLKCLFGFHGAIEIDYTIDGEEIKVCRDCLKEVNWFSIAERITAHKTLLNMHYWRGFSFLIGGEMKVQDFDGWYEHKCPGCNELHFIAVDEPFENGQQWTFNGDVNKPTFSPSINIVGKCHYFIKDGFIQYCSDSKHELAGQTIELPDMG